MSVKLASHENQAVVDLRWKKFPLGAHGFVALVDAMGSDSAIAQAARVSYGTGTRQVHDDEGLIRYLLRHEHTTPFEMCEVKLLVQVPMDCWRQWIRHRTASVNEYSTRYSEAIEGMATTRVGEWRHQAVSNRQGSSGSLREDEWPEGYSYHEADLRLFIAQPHGDPITYRTGEPLTPGAYLTQREQKLHKLAKAIYVERLAFDVAREQARKNLLLSNYTRAYWKIDLHNLIHFLGLRMDLHAQLEIRSYADVIGKEIVAKLFPITWQAFLDYKLHAMTLSALDIKLVDDLMRAGRDAGYSPPFSKALFAQEQPAAWRELKRCRERDECIAKLLQMGIINFGSWD